MSVPFNKCVAVCVRRNTKLEHPNPSPAYSAIIATSERKVSKVYDFFENIDSWTIIPSTIFTPNDFNWFCNGMFIPLSALSDLATAGYDSMEILSMARKMSISLKKEPSNRGCEDHQAKAGDAFTVTSKPEWGEVLAPTVNHDMICA